MTVLDRKACEEQEEEMLPYHDVMRKKGSKSSVSWNFSGCRKIGPIYIKYINITTLFCMQTTRTLSCPASSSKDIFKFLSLPHIHPSLLPLTSIHLPLPFLPLFLSFTPFFFLMLDSSYIGEWSREDQRAQTLATDNGLPHMTPCLWTIKLPSVPLSFSLNGGEKSYQ